MTSLVEDEAREGCLPCRRQRQRCDTLFPRCAHCRRSRRSCFWASETSLSSRSSTNQSQRCDSPGRAETPRHLARIAARTLDMREVEQMTYYMSKFHNYSHQMCAWTDLLELPKRSTIPSIARINKRTQRGMTNWANYYLPYLASGATDDPLSLAMVTLTAYKSKDYTVAISFYAKVIHQLRHTLRKQESLDITDQDSLKIWATTLLLAEYEAQQGNQWIRAHHIEGATTLCFLVRNKRAPGQPLSSTLTQATTEKAQLQESFAETRSGKSKSEMPERIGAYLQELTQRYRHSSTICLPIAKEWPSSEPRSERKSTMTRILAQSADCFAYCMPIPELYFNRLNNDPPTTEEELASFRESFAPSVARARIQLNIYKELLHESRDVSAVHASCSEPGVPFSPVIKFGNPHMAQAHLVLHVLIVLLCPFIRKDEVEGSLRFIAGVYASLGTSEFLIDAAYPDVYIFAFWKAGREREYFEAHLSRRHSEFQRLVRHIWRLIDANEAHLGCSLSNIEIVRLTLREYKAAQANAILHRNTRYYQIEGCMARTWSVAIGSDPSTNFKEGPHTYKYRKRINALRESFQGLSVPDGKQNDTVFGFRESGPLRDQEIGYNI